MKPALSKLLRVFILAGATLIAAATARAEVVPGWVLVTKDFRETLATTSVEEKDTLVQAGWMLDGMAGFATQGGDGIAPLHRLWRAGKTGADRLLETDLTKLAEHEKAGFKDEGIVGFVSASDGPGHVAVVQYAKGERKLWLAGAALQEAAVKAGWKKQGVHFWLLPAPAH